MEGKTKVCSRCGKERPIAKFAFGKTATRRNICNYCLMEQGKERAEKNKAFWLEMDWIYHDKVKYNG